MIKESFSHAFDPLKKEIERQKQDRKNRPHFSFVDFCKKWGFRLFHTLLVMMITYIVVLSCTIFIPASLAVIIGGFGYDMSNNVQLLLAGSSCLFFVAWIFLGSFALCRLIWRAYIRNIKTTLP